MILRKRATLKKKYVILLTILLTVFGMKTLKIVFQMFKQHDAYIKELANKCDSEKSSTCSYYEIRQYLLNR